MPTVGLDAKLYYGAAGAMATNELTNCKDLTLSQEVGGADSTTRGAKWRKKVPTLFEGSLEWEMVWKPSDSGFTAIKDAFYNRAAIALAALDSEDGSGWEGDFMITSFSRSEPLEDVLTVSVKAEPTDSDREPQWID